VVARSTRSPHREKGGQTEGFWDKSIRETQSEVRTVRRNKLRGDYKEEKGTAAQGHRPVYPLASRHSMGKVHPTKKPHVRRVYNYPNV